ncbi:exodeoxyribonuclease VII large subunit [Candidatus Bipolaricaulota bacterium]|nr:exodeoxyribonuclease VII large subunit [Candidatus Bipolaricaulota bacterium]
MENSEPDLFSAKDGPEKDEIFSVSRLNKEARYLLEKEFSSIWVEGEVSNLHISSAGHHYFTLKEEDSEIDCVMFSGDASTAEVEPEDGMAVQVKATLTVYEKRGRYQLKVREVKEVGEGELQKKFRQLKRKLKKEGLFDESNKKPLPGLPKSVGVITSPTGAAVRDIVSTMEERYPALSGYIFPVKVQGEEAGGLIASAIERANELASRLELEVLIVSRGGGSLEDLWPFNEEIVARAIYESDLPVVSGVGHEVDFTISDFVADTRVPTPTAAGKEVVPDRAEIFKEVEGWIKKLGDMVSSKIQDHQNELDRVKSSFGFRLPFRKLEDTLQEYDDLTQELETSGPEVFGQREDSLEGLLKRLSLANPTRLLRKGYSVTYREDGAVVTDSAAVDQGESLKTVLHKGIIRSVVSEVLEDE